MRARTLLAAAACAAIIPSAAALAAAAHPNLASSDLWATVDVCNTPAHAETIGVRGSMPGTGDPHELMYMRVVVEYRSSAGRWRRLAGGASGAIAVGNASARVRQAGQSFTLAPNATHGYLLRGVVTFEWLLGGHTVASTIRSTTAGHHPGAGADPAGYSAELCSIPAKRRGSLVITPVTPSAARRAITRASFTVHA